MTLRISRDPARAGLPLHRWPPGCLAPWEAVKTQSSSPFRKDGGGKRWAIATVLKSEKGLRRILGFAARVGALHDGSVPLDFLESEFLDDYYAHLVACENADRSIVGRFCELEFAFRIMYPGRDFGWLTRPDGLALSAGLSMAVKPRFVPSSAVLLEWAEELYESGLRKLDRQIRWALVRDALMIGILATRGPRRRALSCLELGKHLIRQPERWLLDQDAAITKTGVDIMLPLSFEISAMADRYIAVERVEMLRGRASNALWIEWQYGRPLKPTSISGMMWRRTLERFGIGFGPHRFRTSLTTTIASESPSSALDGSLLLAHSPRISLKNYNKANAIAAGNRHAEELAALRAETAELAKSAFSGHPSISSRVNNG